MVSTASAPSISPPRRSCSTRSPTSWRGHGLLTPKSRVVLEKPLGKDLRSAQAINAAVGEVLDEKQIYRIDHYLGKETVQNLMALRFANLLFEPVWNKAHVDHVQITVSETVGVEGRGGYYDTAGALRDMLQNHMLQLLCLVAMEPPSAMEADALRDEKLKVLARAGADRRHQCARTLTVRGQYKAGVVDGKAVPGYLEELPDKATKARPRPSSRSRPPCRPGAGPACRSTCAPASGCRRGSPRSSSSSARCRCRSSGRPRQPFVGQPARHPPAARRRASSST